MAGLKGLDDDPIPEKLEALVAPHIDSFDYFIARGLDEAVCGLEPVEIEDPSRHLRLRLWLERPVVMKPYADESRQRFLYPTECREGKKTYAGEFRVDLVVEYNASVAQRLHVSLGKLPIMVKSSLCHLRNLTQKQLVRRKEERLEMGGYFICNGIERIVRLLIVPKRNYVTAVRRGSYARKGQGYSNIATTIRCTRKDQTSVSVRVIYMQDGTANLSFTLQKNEYFIPVSIVLKALVETSDHEIFDRIAGVADGGGGKASLGTQFVRDRALLIVSQLRKRGLLTHTQALQYLGQNFRVVLGVPDRVTDAFVGKKVLHDFVFVHLDMAKDKFNLLIFMLHKLFAVVDGTAQEDNVDTLQHHELLVPGHLMAMAVKERLQLYLDKLKEACEKELREKPGTTDLRDTAALKRCMDKGVDNNVGKRVEYLLNTGNLLSRSGLDLQQASGFTVVAEKLNFLRYLSHFRSVHRGAFFAELRTTTVRKLLPESWGFLCPVHTPDGSPCGLLMHLTRPCVVTGDLDDEGNAKEFEPLLRGLSSLLSRFGLQSAASGALPPPPPAHLAVFLDGCILGYLPAARAAEAAAKLRRLKVGGHSTGVPSDLEVAYIPPTPLGTYPGLFLASTPARMMRPVRQLAGATEGPGQGDAAPLELIGPLEQTYMEIACPDGSHRVAGGGRLPGDPPPTHEETEPTAMLSVVASLTPWSDYNQSPRNMYQCQMGKQTMGFPLQAFRHRPDNKLYRIQTPQTPIARTGAYSSYCMDDFPTGTNAVVAVLAHTGYDMEDAMIINKSSMERGLFHGQLYKTETVDLTEKRGRNDSIATVFGRKRRGRGAPPPGGISADHFVDIDGLPYVGRKIDEDEPYCSTLNTVTGRDDFKKLKGADGAIVDQVTLVGTGAKEPLQKVTIRLRYDRNPTIGDKFSSRHGQKGVLSQLWPDVNMPFCYATGMRPDVIINPHAFPSRMTIGMLVESMASKAGALDGRFVNATPFRSSSKAPPPLLFPANGRQHGQPGADQEGKETLPSEEGKETLVDEFGKKLVDKGYSYYGTEVMYNGMLGEEMTCHIFIGLVYYQRLRHMVSDKFQVRSTGAVNQLTQQPVKGRKFGGGIRFGEMERDALLSHGAAFLLRDRLFTCSDYHTADVCSRCGSLLSPTVQPVIGDVTAGHGLGPGSGGGTTRKRVVLCRVCNTGRFVERVALPYVFKYLAAELAAMNIKLTLKLSE